jgi:hypothetical protein
MRKIVATFAAVAALLAASANAAGVVLDDSNFESSIASGEVYFVKFYAPVRPVAACATVRGGWYGEVHAVERVRQPPRLPRGECKPPKHHGCGSGPTSVGGPPSPLRECPAGPRIRACTTHKPANDAPC